jgi:hypothetical protein
MTHDLEQELAWYRRGLNALKRAKVPFMVGGAYALWKYTGVRRPTKDLDLFMKPSDLPEALRVLREIGCRTEVTARHWLGKAFYKGYLIDFILGMANGVDQVDDSWFKHATKQRLIGVPVQIVGPEHMIWSKAFVMERDRYDGADIAHLILMLNKRMDWKLLVERFSGHEAVLLNHLILFRYIYPHEQECIPAWAFRQLINTVQKKNGVGLPPRLCRGTYFSRTQYIPDVERRNYQDARLLPYGPLTAQQILE